MKAVMDIIANYFYQYGKNSANMPSYRGIYEDAVPYEFSKDGNRKINKELQNQNQKQANIKSTCK